jgi:hydrogenase maturation protein HypF
VHVLCETRGARTVVLSGGVMQNQLFVADLHSILSASLRPRLWTNRDVPPNDGGISLGQAALAEHRPRRR